MPASRAGTRPAWCARPALAAFPPDLRPSRGTHFQALRRSRPSGDSVHARQTETGTRIHVRCDRSLHLPGYLGTNSSVVALRRAVLNPATYLRLALVVYFVAYASSTASLSR